MGQRGFWDEQQRVVKLKNKKPVLQRLPESIPWESFRLLFDKGYASATFRGSGNANLDFGNCWKPTTYSSVVAVYLNGRLIGIARQNQDSVIVNFNYKKGDVLKLSNGYDAKAIIKINSFLLQACGNISFNLNRYKF